MSDHISGPRALSDPIADITDVYAFPSPERPGRLVLVMNTLPFAKPWDALSDGLIYRFRLRPLIAGRARRRGAVHGGRRRGRLRLRVLRARAPERASALRAGGHVHDAGRRDRRVPRQRPGRRRGARCPGLRRRALGPVHHGRPRRAEDHRHGEAGVHRPVVDLPRRQGRPQPRRGARHRASRRRGAGGRRRRDAHARRVQRADRARRTPRGQEHDVGPEAVRPGQPRPGDPRPLQQRGRVPAWRTATSAPTGPG